MKRHLSRRQWMVMLLMAFSIFALMFTATVASEQAPIQVAKARGMIVFDADEVVEPDPMDLSNFTAKARGMIVFDVENIQG